MECVADARIPSGSVIRIFHHPVLSFQASAPQAMTESMAFRTLCGCLAYSIRSSGVRTLIAPNRVDPLKRWTRLRSSSLSVPYVFREEDGVFQGRSCLWSQRLGWSLVLSVELTRNQEGPRLGREESACGVETREGIARSSERGDMTAFVRGADDWEDTAMAPSFGVAGRTGRSTASSDLKIRGPDRRISP